MDRSVIIKSKRQHPISYEDFPYELLNDSESTVSVLTQDKFYTLSSTTLSKNLKDIKRRKQILGIRIIIYSILLMPGMLLGILFTYKSIFINLVFLAELSKTQQDVISFLFHLSLIFFTGVIYSIYTEVYRVDQFAPSDYILPNLKLIDLSNIPQTKTSYLNYFNEDVLNLVLLSVKDNTWDSIVLFKLVAVQPECEKLLNSLEINLDLDKLNPKEFPKLNIAALNSFLTYATQFAIETNNSTVTIQNLFSAFLYVFPYFYTNYPQVDNYHTLVAATQIESEQKILKTPIQLQLSNLFLVNHSFLLKKCTYQIHAKAIRTSAPLSIRITSVLKAPPIPNVALFPTTLQKDNFINTTSHEHRGPVAVIDLSKSHDLYTEIGPSFTNAFSAIKKDSIVFIDGWDENPGILKRTQTFIKQLTTVLTKRKCRVFVVLNSNVAQNYDLREILGMDMISPTPEDIQTEISTIQNFLSELKPTTIALYAAYILSDVLYPVKDRVSATIGYLKRFSIPNIDSARVFKSTAQMLDKTKEELESIIYLSRREEEVYGEVIGQKHTVKKIFKALKRKMILANEEVKTILSFLVVAPTKWGKRHLLTVVHNKLFPNEKVMIINMEKGNIIKALKKSQNPVTIIFENIEKSKPSALEIILQILSKGKLLIDKKTFDFTQTIIFLTISSLPKEYFSERQLPHVTIENLTLLKIKHLIDARLFTKLEGLAVLELPDIYEILEYIRTFVVANGKKLDSQSAVTLAMQLYKNGSSYSSIRKELQKLPSV